MLPVLRLSFLTLAVLLISTTVAEAKGPSGGTLTESPLASATVVDIRSTASVRNERRRTGSMRRSYGRAPWSASGFSLVAVLSDLHG